MPRFARWLILIGALPAFAGALQAAPPPEKVKFATWNVSFFRGSAGALVAELNQPAGTSANHARIRRVAEALQRIRPDVVLLNEFDYDAAGQAMTLFHDNFLAVPQQAGLAGLSYPWRCSGPSNTGISTGLDLDNNGTAVTTPGTEAYGNDCFGFGIYPGQYGLAVFSRFPIDAARIRSLQLLKWQDMPGNQLLANTGNPPLTDYYSPAERQVLRLSSKTHLDVPVDLGGGILAHFLVSHPTPPSFDGAENKNGKRNFDEIRVWSDYVDPARSGYLRDDAGVAGGLPEGARFVIAGDQNADPNDGDSLAGAARQLTLHPLVNASFIPSSGANGGGANFSSTSNGQVGNRIHDTAAFAGGLRVDYVLPSRAGFSVFNGAVLWPGPADPLRSLIGDSDPSDHHLVWMELRPQVSLAEAVRTFRAEWSGTAVVLGWQAAAGYAYQVQQSVSLAAGSWEDTGLAPVIAPDTLQATVSIPPPAGGASRKFYRLQVGFAP